MERNPLASLMMGLRGGGGSTEGARAYPGGYDPAPWAKSSFAKSQADLELEKAIEDLTKAFPEAPQANLAEIAKTALENQAARPAPRTVPEYLPGQPTVRAYHGTQTGPINTPEEIAARGQTLPSYLQEMWNPDKFRTPDRTREQGVFFTPDPETASRYAGYSKPATSHPYDVKKSMEDVSRGAKVFPVDLDMKNSVTVDLRKIPGMTDYQRIYDPKYVTAAIEQARQQNKDFVVIKGMEDVGGAADQIIALKPAGKVKSALTGETLYTHPLSALLAAALAGGAVAPRQRVDETTIAPENIGRP